MQGLFAGGGFIEGGPCQTVALFFLPPFSFAVRRGVIFCCPRGKRENERPGRTVKEKEEEEELANQAPTFFPFFFSGVALVNDGFSFFWEDLTHDHHRHPLLHFTFLGFFSLSLTQLISF